LRARSDLPAELNWHRAAVANQLGNIETIRELVTALNGQLAPARNEQAGARR
jgi:hypothetical protein